MNPKTHYSPDPKLAQELHTMEGHYSPDPSHYADIHLFIENLPKDYIPYWDNKDPGIPDVIRDSSAASIAAAGLLELSNYAFNKDSRNKCSTAATNILRSLCSFEYLAEESNSYGILRHATWKKPTDPQADTSLIWGDYNYLEALLRYNEANFGKDLKK